MNLRTLILGLTLAVAVVVATPARSVHAAPSTGSVKAAMGALELAKHHYKQGNFKKAAKLFIEAYGIHPNPAFLFNAGRAQQRAFALSEAEATYKKYLQVERKDKRGRSRAEMHLSEIAEVRKQLKRAREEGQAKAPATAPATAPTKTADKTQAPAPQALSKPAVTATPAAVAKPVAQPPVAAVSRAPMSAGRLMAWVSAVGGALGVVGGAVLLVQGESTAQSLASKVETQGGKSVNLSMSRAAYQSEYDHVQNMRLGGGVAIGVGVVATAVGTYLLLRRPQGAPSVSWSPTRGGGVLRASLRF